MLAACGNGGTTEGTTNTSSNDSTAQTEGIEDNASLTIWGDAAASFDSIEFFEGNVEPGETREAEFIADTYTADEYYFETGSGAIASGAYSEIRWTFTAKEAGRD